MATHGLEIYNNTLYEFRAALAAAKAANPELYAQYAAERTADAEGNSSTRGIVLEAYYLNPDAAIDPDEVSIRYWMYTGIGTSRSTFKAGITQANSNDQISYFNNLEDRAIEKSMVSPLTLNQVAMQDGVTSLNVFDVYGTNLTKILLATNNNTNYIDATGHTPTITNSSTGTYDLDYKLYDSMEFNGQSNYIQAGNIAGLALTGESYCIEFWVHGDSLGGSVVNNLSYDNTYGGQIGYQVWLSNGTIYWRIYRSGTDADSVAALSGALQVGVWNHVVCNSHLDRRALYINGNLITTSQVKVNQLSKILSMRLEGTTGTYPVPYKMIEITLDYTTYRGSPNAGDWVTFEGYTGGYMGSGLAPYLFQGRYYQISSRLNFQAKLLMKIGTNETHLSNAHLAANPVYLRNTMSPYEDYPSRWTDWATRKWEIACSGPWIGKSAEYLVTDLIGFTIDYFFYFIGGSRVSRVYIKTCPIAVGDRVIGIGDLIGFNRLTQGVTYYISALEYVDGGFLGIGLTTSSTGASTNVYFDSFKTYTQDVTANNGTTGFGEVTGFLAHPPEAERIPQGFGTLVGYNSNEYLPSLRQYFSGYISNLRIVKDTPVYVNYYYPYTITPPRQKLTATQSMWTNGSGYAISGSATGMLLNTYNSQLSTRPLVDTSTYKLTLTGGVPTVGKIKSKYLGSKYFDGKSTYSILSCNSYNQAQLAGDFTVEAWIYPMKYASSNSAPVGIIGTQLYTSSSTLVWSLALGGNKYGLTFNVINAAGSSQYVFDSRTTGSGIELNTWSHVAVTGNTTSGLYRLWLNGTKIDERTHGGISSLNTADGNLYIGRCTTEFFKGYIASPRIVGKQVYYTTFIPSNRPPSISKFSARYAFAITPGANLHPTDADCQYWMWRGFDTGKNKNFSTEDITWNQVAIINKKVGSGTQTFNYPLLIGKTVLVNQILVNTPDALQTYYAWSIDKSTATTTGNITIGGGTTEAIITVLMK